MVDGWNAYLVETTSGQVGKRLGISGHSWSVPLNKMETGSITARKEELLQIDRERFSPDIASVLLTYTFQGVERPWVAGPITDWPSETEDELTIDFTGIRGLLEGRLALADDSVSSKKSVSFKGLSLGTIAQEVVALAQDRPGGLLPITFGTPREELTPGHERTYQWFDLANLNVDSVLTKLTEVIDGPDVMFRPEYTNENKTHISWVMLNGTKAQPEIAQDWAPSFDTTSSHSGIAKYEIAVSGSRRVSRVYATGSGQDKGTLIRSHEDLTAASKGYPFREAVLSSPDETKADVLISQAKAHVKTNLDVIREVSLTVRADHPNFPLGRWHVGDRAMVTLKNSLKIPDGTYSMTIIESSGNESGNITLKLQED